MSRNRILSAAWLVLGLVLAVLLTAPAADVTIAGNTTNPIYGNNEFRFTVQNTGTATITSVDLFNSTTGTWGSSTQTVDFKGSASSTPSGLALTYGDIRLSSGPTNITAGTSKIGTAYVRFGGYHGTSYTASINTTFTLRANFAGGGSKEITLPFVCSFSATMTEGATRVMTPNPFNFVTWSVSNVTPPSSVTMTGWTGASAAATVTGTGFANIPATLTASDSTTVSISNSDAVPDGSLIQVVSGGSVLGSGIVSKGPDGSFSLTIPVAPPPAGGRVRAMVKPGKDFRKSVKLFVTRVDGPPEAVGSYGLTRGSPIDWTTENAALYASPGWAEIRDVDGGVILARAPVQKDASGAFDVLMEVDGDSDPDEIRDNIARFELDLLNYRDEARTVELQVFNGSTWVTVRTANTHGSDSGIRKTLTHEMDNSGGQWSGRQYRWKTGETVIAAGTTPAPAVSYDPEGNVLQSFGFRVSSNATIGYTPEELEQREEEEATKDTDGDGVPDREDFPEEPPDGTPEDTDGDGVPDGRAETATGMTRGEAHDDIATAVKKALDAPGDGKAFGNTQPPENDGSLDKLKKLTDGTQGLKGLVDAVANSVFASGEGLGVNIVGQSYTLTLPTVPRPTVLDLSPWASMLAAVRSILAAIVTWYFALYGLKALRSSFV